ncbi:hypothetical protein HDA40_001642 [Hamadaea flava]|uniref:Uncharacterized protein n=1 Tax=Hamadaea flava TaxID=1742688 RepID=A0ABV8LND7_9ACTN|nr:hypothetical protein [Hamadaea flava]MCP2323135.1 hypothetical protein [Hamadaea flava]
MTYADAAYAIKVHEDRSDEQDRATRANDARSSQTIAQRLGGTVQARAYDAGRASVADFTRVYRNGQETNDNNRLAMNTVQGGDAQTVHALGSFDYGTTAVING